MEASAVPRGAPAGVAALASPGLLRLLSDDRLVALIRDGNRNAFEAVYDRHYRSILSFCRHMLGCADEAEDAVQHTFLAAYNDLVSSRKPIRLRAWLFTIARNRCLSILRARRERTALEFEELATDGLAVQVQRRQDLRDLVIDINHLPEDQRAALVLAEMGALSHDEIGSVLGVPKDKVKALIFQARESLLADRAAREADCREIREQLATMRGAALRRTTLRRHLRGCQGCREYRHELERQRRRLAVILPVAPTIALREAVVGVTAGGGIAGAGVAGGGLLGASSLLKGMAGKALIAAMFAAAGTTGTILVVHDFRLHVLRHGPPPLRQLPSAGVLGAAKTQLAPHVALGSTASAGGTSATVVALTHGSALVTAVASRPQTATTKTLVHALTGQLANLLTSAGPHETLVKGGGAVSPIATPTPIPSPGIALPVTLSPTPPSTLAPPTAGLPSDPTGGLSAPAPGPIAGGPMPGTLASTGLHATSGAPGSVGGSGSSGSAGATGSGPLGSGSAGSAGATGSGPLGSGSAGSAGATGSGPLGSGGGSTGGPSPSPSPGQGPAPGQPHVPVSPGASDPGSPAGTGPGDGAGSSTPAGAGSGTGSDPGSSAGAGSASGSSSSSPAGAGPASGSASGAPVAAGSPGASAPLPASGASTSTPAAPPPPAAASPAAAPPAAAPPAAAAAPAAAPPAPSAG